MPDNQAPLTDDERAELERLRAEKQSRERARVDAARRAELERLRREQADADAERRDAERRERARTYMEPDEDYRMPFAQKLVLLIVALVIALFVVNFVGSGALGH